MKLAKEDPEAGIREMAVRARVARKADVSTIAKDEKAPASVRAEAVASVTGKASVHVAIDLLSDRDPYLRHAAIRRLSQPPEDLLTAMLAAQLDPKLRVGALLAWRASADSNRLNWFTHFFTDSDPDVRFLAIKWVSDEKLTQFRPQIAAMMQRPDLDPREFTGLATALARLDNKPVDPDNLAAYFLDRLKDDKAPIASRLMALKAVPAKSKRVKTDQLAGWLRVDDKAFRVEVLRAIKDRGDKNAADAVKPLVADAGQPVTVRAQAIATLVALDAIDVDQMIRVASGPEASLRQEALRALVQVKGIATRPVLQDHRIEDRDLVARLVGKPFFANRPPATDTDAWLKRLDGPADAEAGRRVFEHAKVATCSKCHRIEGRGADIGPDLSLIGRTDRKWIVESILQPSAVVAPHYQPWKVDTVDGKSRVGLLVGTHLDESVYVDAKGDVFKVLANDVADAVPTKGSVMPDNLIDTLTDQELRDLVAFLAAAGKK
jgi:putative heme-binding domain-containing protein